MIYFFKSLFTTCYYFLLVLLLFCGLFTYFLLFTFAKHQINQQPKIKFLNYHIMDIFNLLKSILNFYQRQWKFILILLLSGAILGFVYDMVKAPYYETSATVTSGLSYFEGIIDPNELDYPIIDQKIAINMVNALAEIVDKNEYEILAKKLNIELEVAQSIKFIEAEQLYELDLENRRQKLSQFLITARITDNNSIRIFSDAL